jgi:hypothetical protein
MLNYFFKIIIICIFLVQPLFSQTDNRVIRKGLFIQAGYDYGVLGGNIEPKREETYTREQEDIFGGIFGDNFEETDKRNKQAKYTPKNNFIMPSITFGYEWSAVGVSFSYSTQELNFKNDLKKTDIDQARESMDFKAKTYLIDVYYKFNNTSKLTPFVGVMFGYSEHEIAAKLNMRAPDSWSPTLLALGAWSIEDIINDPNRIRDISEISKELNNSVTVLADSKTTTFGFKGGAQYNFTQRFAMVMDVSLMYMAGKMENVRTTGFQRVSLDEDGDVDAIISGTMKMTSNIGIPIATMGLKLKYYIW